MIGLFLSVGVLAEEDTALATSGICGADGDNAKWVITGSGDNTTLTISGTGATLDVSADRDNNGYNMLAPDYQSRYSSSVDSELVKDRDEKITRIVIEDGITAIGKGSFQRMPNVTEVVLPETLKSIGDWAFRGMSKVRKLEIPDGVTFIGGGAFKDWNALETLVIPDSVTVIGHDNTNSFDSRVGAFQNCTSLKSVQISKSLKIIYNWTFSGCTSLKTVEIPSGVTRLGSEVKSDGNWYDDSLYMDGIGVFEGCTALESITIPSTVKTIYEYAFYQCGALKDIYYEGSESDWKTVDMHNVGNWDTAMQARMHYNCKSGKIYTAADYKGETDLVIPEGTTRIDDYALAGCAGIRSVTLPSSLNYIGVYAFQNCTGLTSVTIPGSVRYITRGAFNGCTSLQEVKFGSGVTLIGTDTEGQFSGQVKPSGFGSFEGCTGLRTVYIPKSVTSIGEYSFYNCPSLRDVYYEGTQEEWKKIPIVNGSNQPVITVATKHYNSYTTSSREPNCPSARFVDVDPNEWYHVYVDYAITAGIMAGVSNDHFSPNAEVTRATLVQVLYALEGKPAVTGGKHFSDVASGQWYATAVSWASANEIVGGYPDGTFRPDKSISRQDMAVMIYAYAKYKGMDTATSASVDSYQDRSKISNYAIPALQWAVGKKYMNGVGDNIMAPLGTTTRAQLATVMKAMIG